MEHPIELLEELSSRSYNLLLCHGYTDILQIVDMDIEMLMSIPKMTGVCAEEIYNAVRSYKENNVEEANDVSVIESSESKLSILREHPEAVLEFARARDIAIKDLDISNRSKNQLQKNGFINISDILFLSDEELLAIRGLGEPSVKEIRTTVEDYIDENLLLIEVFASGDTSVLYSDEQITKFILDLYRESPFAGLNLNDMKTALSEINGLSDKRLKQIIAKIIADGTLEYVDYRCYRKYSSFEDELVSGADYKDRVVKVVQMRLNSKTFEEIATEEEITRQGAQQLGKQYFEKVRNSYIKRTGITVFDDDYYAYLYSHYFFDKEIASTWLGISESTYNYLKHFYKNGSTDLEKAIYDDNIARALKVRINNYSNRKNVFIDGRWIVKKRSSVEEFILKNYFTEKVGFDEFVECYNRVLEDNHISKDSGLYITDEVKRSRVNRLSDSRCVLWNFNSQFRYYNIDEQDYTELLSSLALDSYDDVELSTLKFFEAYPKLMKEYDVRDQYELHNLLRKVLENYESKVVFEKMPHLRFGNPSRDNMILDLIIENSPLSQSELVALMHEHYGYDERLAATYISNSECINYYHNQCFNIDQTIMSDSNRTILKNLLTEDFYYFKEIKEIYKVAIPNADLDEVNPFNLKDMGYSVYSNFILQNHDSLHDYFSALLLKEDVIESLKPLRRRYSMIQTYYDVVSKLERNLEIIETTDHEEAISIRRLEKHGITKSMLRDFSSAVYDFVKEEEFFTIKMIKDQGFDSELFEFGFDDWFYGNVIKADDRFNCQVCFKTMLFSKGNRDVNAKNLLIGIIENHDSIDAVDLMSILKDKYGCSIKEKSDITYKVKDSDVVYDSFLDKYYANRTIRDYEIYGMGD